MTYEIQFELAPLNSILSFYLFILSFFTFYHSIKCSQNSLKFAESTRPDSKIIQLELEIFYTKKK